MNTVILEFLLFSICLCNNVQLNFPPLANNDYLILKATPLLNGEVLILHFTFYLCNVSVDSGRGDTRTSAVQPARLCHTIIF